MKKFFAFIGLAVFASSTFATNPINLRDEMMIMSQRLVLASKASSSEECQNNISAFINAAEHSKVTMPTKWNGDQSQFPGYQQGIQKVIDVATEASNLAKEGKLDAAKTKLYEMSELRQMYHKLYK